MSTAKIVDNLQAAGSNSQTGMCETSGGAPVAEGSYNLIDARTLRDRVIERIQSAIVHGELPSRVHRRETQLAQDLGVSRGPVREALQEIALTGYITTVPSKIITRKQRAG